jgi:hypothetical protein
VRSPGAPTSKTALILSTQNGFCGTFVTAPLYLCFYIAAIDFDYPVAAPPAFADTAGIEDLYTARHVSQRLVRMAEQ